MNEFELLEEKESNEITRLKNKLSKTVAMCESVMKLWEDAEKRANEKEWKIIELYKEISERDSKIIKLQSMTTELGIDYNRKRDYPNLTIEEYEEKLRNVFNSNYFSNVFNNKVYT